MGICWGSLWRFTPNKRGRLFHPFADIRLLDLILRKIQRDDVVRLVFLFSLFLSSLAFAQTHSWRGDLMPEAVEACGQLPNFERLLAFYYTAQRTDLADEANLKALRDFSALAVRHAPFDQAAFLFRQHIEHNQGQPLSSAVTKSLVDAYLSDDRRDELLSLILAPPDISGRALAELKFMTVVALTQRGEGWIAYELQRRNPGIFEAIDLDFAFYLGAVRAQNPTLIERFEDRLQLIELQAFRAGLAEDYRTYFSYIDLGEARRNKALAAFAYGLSFRSLSPDFDQIAAPLKDIFDPALIANVLARRGRASWTVEMFAAANRAPQFGGRVYADLPLAEELVRQGHEEALREIYARQFLDTAPGLAVSLMRSGEYDAVWGVLSGLSNSEIGAINPLLVLAIVANNDQESQQESWSNTAMRTQLFDNFNKFAPAFAEEEGEFTQFLQQMAQNSRLSTAQIDFNLNLLTNLLELEGRYGRAAEVVARIQSPALRLRSANSLAQSISHRCFGGFQTVSPFYPFTLGSLDLDADYRLRTLRVF